MLTSHIPAPLLHLPRPSSMMEPQNLHGKHGSTPASLSNRGDASQIQGNVSAHVKQLILNTFIAYGAGDEQCFGHHVAKAVKFVDVSAYDSKEKQGRMEAITTAEVVVDKSMLNGAGMLHGGCLAFLIDNCCSTPLVALGLIQNINGVGVTQAMNVLFHSPASSRVMSPNHQYIYRHGHSHYECSM
ncbi:hypothetical protein J3R82DRAFT_7976 [Butyriboletus roseoflavus]|nr:hypothetical protein J3R82DRAFT_7976 [Butyriboletus roseoflavus]